MCIRDREYARRNQQAIDDYEQIVQKEKIDCDFKRVPMYLYTKKRRESLRQEELAARSLSVACRFKGDTELPFEVAGALEFPDQAQFHPCLLYTSRCV